MEHNVLDNVYYLLTDVRPVKVMMPRNVKYVLMAILRMMMKQPVRQTIHIANANLRLLIFISKHQQLQNVWSLAQKTFLM